MRNTLHKTIKNGFLGIFLYFIAFTWACGGGENEYWKIVKNIELSDPNTMMLNKVGFINGDLGIGFSGNSFFATTNGGDTWEAKNNVGLPCIQGMDIIGDNAIVMDCTCSQARFSEDQGKTWVSLNFTNSEMISFKDKNTGWGANTTNLIKFNSGNSTEVQIPKEFLGSITAIDCISAEQLYMLNRDGKLVVTTDGGTTWKSVELNMNSGDKKYHLFARGVAMRFSDLNNGMIIAYEMNGKEWTEFLTADGGKTWKTYQVVKAEDGTCFLSRDMSFITIRTTDDSRLILLQAKI